MNIPEITVQALNIKISSEHHFIILDVREKWEVEKVSLKDNRVIILPMSQLAQSGLNAIPDCIKNMNFDIIIICHHGIRSAYVTNWLVNQGWKNVYSLQGGVNAYAREINAAIGFY